VARQVAPSGSSRTPRFASGWAADWQRGPGRVSRAGVEELRDPLRGGSWKRCWRTHCLRSASPAPRRPLLLAGLATAAVQRRVLRRTPSSQPDAAWLPRPHRFGVSSAEGGRPDRTKRSRPRRGPLPAASNLQRAPQLTTPPPPALSTARYFEGCIRQQRFYLRASRQTGVGDVDHIRPCASPAAVGSDDARALADEAPTHHVRLFPVVTARRQPLGVPRRRPGLADAG